MDTFSCLVVDGFHSYPVMSLILRFLWLLNIELELLLNLEYLIINSPFTINLMIFFQYRLWNSSFNSNICHQLFYILSLMICKSMMKKNFDRFLLPSWLGFQYPKINPKNVRYHFFRGVISFCHHVFFTWLDENTIMKMILVEKETNPKGQIVFPIFRLFSFSLLNA